MAKREPMSPEERVRINRDYQRLQQEEARESAAREEERAKAGKAREAEAKRRMLGYQERIGRLGFTDLINVGVQTTLWDEDGPHPEVYVCLPGSQASGTAEEVLQKFLERLEAMLAQRET